MDSGDRCSRRGRGAFGRFSVVGMLGAAVLAAGCSPANQRSLLELGAAYQAGSADMSTITSYYGTGSDVSMTTLSLKAGYEADKLVANVTVPLVIVSGMTYGGYIPFPLDQTVSGLGDIKVEGDYYVYQQGGIFGGAIGMVKFPTGDTGKGLGTGEFDFGAGASGVWAKGKFTGVLRAMYCFLGDTDDEEIKDGWTVTAIVSARLKESWTLSGMLEFKEATTDTQGNTVTLFLPVKYAREKGWGSVSPYFGLSDSAPDFGISVSAGFTFD